MPTLQDMRRRQQLFAFVLALLFAGEVGRAEEKAEPPKVGAVPAKVRENLKLGDFYAKHADAKGLPVVASKAVDDRALLAAADILNRMIATRPDVRKAVVENKVRVGIIGAKEQTTDLPEYATLKDRDWWNKRARGLGATRSRPATSVGEENLLGLTGDRYRGESILIHEFAHTYHELGLNSIDKTFQKKLRAAFENAKAKGLWAETYSLTNDKEYWAEGVQSYFDANKYAAKPNGVHNHVNTREKLKAYDPELFELIDAEFRGEKWRWTPPVENRKPTSRRGE